MSLDPLVSLGRRHGEFIRGSLNYLLDLPEPGHEWVVAECPPGVFAKVNSLNAKRFIQKEGRASQYPTTFRYTTNPEAYDEIQNERERRDLLPCGHTGIKNHGGGDYSCGYEYCDAVHSRDVVEEVLHG